MSRLHLLILLVLVGCVTAIPVITEKQYKIISNRWPGTTLQELHSGRQLYIDKCAGCHSLYKPGALTDEEWRKAMDKMHLKANLTIAEKELVLKYLLSTKLE
jgi:cbb3-type cytochrome oxidase cytochrome c subunit